MPCSIGLAGIGLATSFVHLTVFAAFWGVVRRDERLAAHLSPAFWTAPAAEIHSLVRLGVPVSATYASEAGMFSVLALVMGAVSDAALAAHNVVRVGLLRGLGDTVSGFRLSVVGYWIVGLPAALLLAFPAGLGAAGVWWGLTLGLATTATLMLTRFRRRVRFLEARSAT